jgi:hypothetical protein
MNDTLSNTNIDESAVLRSDGSDGRQPGSFVPGTMRPPGAGRKPGARGKIAALRLWMKNLCEKEKLPFADPVQAMFYMGATGLDPLEKRINDVMGENSPYHPSKVFQDTVDRDGRRVKVRIGGFIPLELRVECLRMAAPYVSTKLSSVEVTGEDGVSLFDADREKARELSKDPDVRRLLEKVAQKNADILETQGSIN